MFWRWWRENGRLLQAGAFQNGRQVGRWRRYYDNGQLWDEGSYEDGEKCGEWKVYDTAGALKPAGDQGEEMRRLGDHI